MLLKKLKISQVKLNPKNPRVIREHKFNQLVQSIKEFPEMLELREIVVDENNIILGGNMRFKACKEAGLKTIDVIVFEGLTDAQKDEFIIKDNANYGQWNWDVLANNFDESLLKNWGLNVWQPDDVTTWENDPLDEDSEQDEDLDSLDVPGDAPGGEISKKKVIQLEFTIDDYDEAFGLVTLLRSKGVDLGEVLINSMKSYVVS
tara:strand:- start:992 stop:1603 length:612 start_codon:yes stop_codon:yes gene_type:complete